MNSDAPAPGGGILLSWVPHRWKGAKVGCAKCGRRVRSGTVHANDQGDPPQNVLCNWCVRELMALGQPEAMN